MIGTACLGLRSLQPITAQDVVTALGGRGSLECYTIEPQQTGMQTWTDVAKVTFAFVDDCRDAIKVSLTLYLIPFGPFSLSSSLVLPSSLPISFSSLTTWFSFSFFSLLSSCSSIPTSLSPYLLAVLLSLSSFSPSHSLSSFLLSHHLPSDLAFTLTLQRSLLITGFPRSVLPKRREVLPPSSRHGR